MKDIEAVDDHVRLLARWDNLDRIIFISNKKLEGMAQKRMNRGSAERFVIAHRQDIVAIAQRHAALHPIGVNKIIVIEETLT